MPDFTFSVHYAANYHATRPKTRRRQRLLQEASTLLRRDTRHAIATPAIMPHVQPVMMKMLIDPCHAADAERVTRSAGRNEGVPAERCAKCGAGGASAGDISYEDRQRRRRSGAEE